MEFDAAARGLQPAGFRVQDLSRIDILVQGSTAAPQTITLTPPQEASFLPVLAGIYTISATAYMSDLILFTASNQVTIATGDTASVQLAMQAALGNVALEIDGETAGAIEAVAGEDVPFVVRVRNLQGRPVPNSAVQIHSSGGFGQVAFTGNNATDALGETRGVIRAPHSGSVTGFSLTVDNRPISIPADLAVEFATNVDAARSGIIELTPTGVPVVADGIARAEFMLVIRNQNDQPLEGIPVTPTSSRNAGLDPSIDQIQLLPGYESGKTDAFGQYRFAVTSTTSSFLQLDEEGRLFSARDAGRVFIPAQILVFADGILVDQREISFNSVVDPFGADMLATPQFVPADGQSSALIVVDVNELPQFGGGPAAGVFVELTNSFNESLNYVLDITPEPGFQGFRTNAQGEWRGRLRSATPVDLFFFAKSDGRSLTLFPRSVFFR